MQVDGRRNVPLIVPRVRRYLASSATTCRWRPAPKHRQLKSNHPPSGPCEDPESARGSILRLTPRKAARLEPAESHRAYGQDREKLTNPCISNSNRGPIRTKVRVAVSFPSSRRPENQPAYRLLVRCRGPYGNPVVARFPMDVMPSVFIWARSAWGCDAFCLQQIPQEWGSSIRKAGTEGAKRHCDDRMRIR